MGKDRTEKNINIMKTVSLIMKLTNNNNNILMN
jgi:hypothetical protein